MLASLRLLISWHVQAAASSFHQLCRKPFASLMTVFIIGIALALPALFWVFTDNISHFTSHWKRSGNISLYLNTSLSHSEQAHLVQRIQNMPGAGQVKLKTPEEGLKALGQQEGMQDILGFLPENPLPPVIVVTPSLAFNDPAKIEHLYQQLKADPDVDQAKLDVTWVKRLYALLNLATWATEVLMMILAAAVMLIIANTLRLALYHRHDEIQILKLIGATDHYILRPFLYLGIWYGLAGALIAALMVDIIVLSFDSAINHLAYVYQMPFSLYGMTLKQILFLSAFATIIGWLAARLSVKRQLKFIEPF